MTTSTSGRLKAITVFFSRNFFKLKSAKNRLPLTCAMALLLIITLGQPTATAQDSSHLRIALLTCTPGEELYSTFGHTAFRVTDSSSVTDYVFNYGTFNFEDAGFYVKFIRGKLLYYLSVEDFRNFQYAYQLENRGITEQVLNLSGDEKLALMRALHENVKDQNKYYQYDFFFDNCTTRPRDMLVKYNEQHPVFKAVMPEGTRFRQAIHFYLDQNQKDWSKLGIDLLLGARTDAVMTVAQSQFLPDNLMKSLELSNQENSLVSATNQLNVVQGFTEKDAGLTPLLVFSVFAFIIIMAGFSRNAKVIALLEGFDGVYFFVTGLMGILLVFMWVGTDHSMTKNNYNLLWAWPTNVIAAFILHSTKKWVRDYFKATSILLVLVLISWFFLPQQMNPALLPLVFLLLWRSVQQILFPGRLTQIRTGN